MLILNLMLTLASLAYALKFLSTNFESAVFAIMQFIGEFGVIYILIVAILMKNQMVDIFKNLSTIYKASKCVATDLL